MHPLREFSRDYPPPENSKDETEKCVAFGGGWVTTKRQIASVDSPLSRNVAVGTIDKRLRKRCNIDILIGESDVLITIPDDDASYL